MRRAMIRRLRRWLYIGHRWIGIFTCLISVVWCLSGIALIYIVQPKVMDAEYRASLNPIAWNEVRIAGRDDAKVRALATELGAAAAESLEEGIRGADVVAGMSAYATEFRSTEDGDVEFFFWDGVPVG